MTIEDSALIWGPGYFHIEAKLSRCESMQTGPVGRCWQSQCQQQPTTSQLSWGHHQPLVFRNFPNPEPLTHFLLEAHLSVHVSLKLETPCLEPNKQHATWKNVRLPASVLSVTLCKRCYPKTIPVHAVSREGRNLQLLESSKIDRWEPGREQHLVSIIFICISGPVLFWRQSHFPAEVEGRNMK